MVCGRRSEPYRYREPVPPKGMDLDSGGPPGFDVGGTRVEPGISQVEFPGGFISRRVMITTKTKF